MSGSAKSQHTISMLKCEWQDLLGELHRLSESNADWQKEVQSVRLHNQWLIEENRMLKSSVVRLAMEVDTLRDGNAMDAVPTESNSE